MLSYSQIFFIIEGVSVTLQYSILSVFFGLFIGSFLALAKVSNIRVLRICADIYTSIFRGTPLIIQLMIVYNVLPQLLGIKLSAFASGIIAFSLNSGAYTSEVIKAGIEAVDKGQFEASKALGIPYRLMMRDIILPQAILKILPSLVNELVNVVKESAIISMIGEMDLMRRAQMVSGETYSYFMTMIVAAVSYYILVMILSKISILVERRIKI
jgi:polar amino acid transport system permease protein